MYARFHAKAALFAFANPCRRLVEQLRVRQKLLVSREDRRLVGIEREPRAQRLELRVRCRECRVECAALVLRIGGALLDDRIVVTEEKHVAHGDAGRRGHAAQHAGLGLGLPWPGAEAARRQPPALRGFRRLAREIARQKSEMAAIASCASLPVATIVTSSP